MRRYFTLKTLKRLFHYFRPYLGITFLYLAMGVFIVALAMVLPQITKYIISSVIGDTPFSLFGLEISDKSRLFIYLVVAWIAIVILRQILAYVRSIIMARATIDAVCSLRDDVFRHMLWQAPAFLQKENTGNILTVINGDTEVISGFFTSTVPAVIEAAFGFIFASIMVGRMNIMLVLCAYLFMIPLYLISKKMGKVFYKWYHFVRESSADLSMVVQENINGIRAVKAYAQEEQEKRKFDKQNEAFCYHAINYMVVWGKNYLPFGIISNLPNIALTLLAALLVINGHTAQFNIGTMELAEFIAVAGYVGYILVPFQQANNWINQTQQAATSADKVFNFLSAHSSISAKPDAKKVDVSSVDLKLNNASLSINGKVILDDITIDLPQGKTLGVMGATGSGKTMLTNVISRFYDVTGGSVEVNGVDVRDMDLTALRACFAPVMQDVFLFSDTIAKNIAFGRPNATYEDVERCARIAQADGFIRQTPDEYNTIVGERGMGLSGGQKQRISIARALLYPAPVLIFDDATSALDMETEEELYSALDKNESGRSRIIIAHRVSSVKKCDEIIMLDKGRIIERGTHDELMALKGRYYEICREQYSSVPDTV